MRGVLFNCMIFLYISYNTYLETKDIYDFYKYNLVTESEIDDLINQKNHKVDKVLIENNKNNVYISTYNDTHLSYHYQLSLPPYKSQNFEEKIYTNYNYTNIEYFDRKNGYINYLIAYLPLLSLVYILNLIISNSNTDEKNSIFDIFSDNMDVSTSKPETKFTDIAGIKTIKKEMKMYVDMMINNKNYIEMGSKIPKGVLLIGEPGCGKTLIAKAIAGEAGINFFSMTGSDFDQILVGVGTLRVQKIFSQAKKNHHPSFI